MPAASYTTDACFHISCCILRVSIFLSVENFTNTSGLRKVFVCAVCRLYPKIVNMSIVLFIFCVFDKNTCIFCTNFSVPYKVFYAPGSILFLAGQKYYRQPLKGFWRFLTIQNCHSKADACRGSFCSIGKKGSVCGGNSLVLRRLLHRNLLFSLFCPHKCQPFYVHAHAQQQHDVCRRGKAQNVDHQAPGKRQQILHQ